MCSQNLDADCLKAVLSRLPLAELIKNVNLQLVSKQFADTRLLGLKAKASQNPVCLEISLDNYKSYVEYLQKKPDWKFGGKSTLLSLGTVPVSISQLDSLSTSYVLGFVSELCIEEKRWHDLPVELANQLSEIIRKLCAVEKLTLKLIKSWLACYSESYYRNKNEAPPQFYAFRELLSGNHTFLATLTSLQLDSSVHSPAFYDDIAADFLQLLRLTMSLSALSVPIRLFSHVLAGSTDLSRLSKLRLYQPCQSERTTRFACQPIAAAVCDACPGLTDFDFSCRESKEYREGKHVCIHDFTVFLKLGGLRCLRLNVEGEGEEILVLPIATLERLTITGRPFYSDDQLLALIDMAPNAKQLHLGDYGPPRDPAIGQALYAGLRERITTGRLRNLASLALMAFNENDEAYRFLPIVTSVESATSLRSISFSATYCDPYEGRHRRNRPYILLDAIRQANSITHLRVPFPWQDSYLLLERLLKAMCQGSIALLTLDTNWDEDCAEMDPRPIMSILPDGCEILEWNVFATKAFPDSVIIRGKKDISDTPANGDASQKYFVAKPFILPHCIYGISRPMCSQTLDADCLKAVLTRLPLAELIKNVNLQLVSKQFAETRLLGLKSKASQTPVCLEISLDNYQRYVEYLQKKPDWKFGQKNTLLSLGTVPVSISQLDSLSTSYVLGFVSELCIEEKRWHDLPVELANQLSDIIRKLCAVEKLTLKLIKSWSACYSESYYRKQNEGPPQFYAFRELISGNHSFLTTLTALQLDSSVNSPAFYDDIAADFLQLLRLTISLSALSAPICLFSHVLASSIDLSRLAKLRLYQPCQSEKTTRFACQPIASAICDACPSLTDLDYSCREPKRYTEGKHVCIHDFTVFQKLSRLRALRLDVAGGGDEISVLPIATLERLTITGRPIYSESQMIALIDMAPNVRFLHFTDSGSYTRCMLNAEFYESLRERIEARRKLQTLTLEVIDNNMDALNSLHILTSVKIPVPLTTVRLNEICSDPYEWRPHRERPLQLLNAITAAENVRHLRVHIDWEESYLILEQLLTAMQRGSLVQLTLDVHWHFSMDKRLFNAVLPSGCEITEWNVFDNNEFPDSVVISGKKLTAAAGDTSGRGDFTQRFFSVRLQNEIR